MSDMVKKHQFRTNERPRLYVEVGGIIVSSGKRYRCIERPMGLCPSDACCGCVFRQRLKSCPPYVCSCFDRHDGKSVWFVLDE